MACSRFEYVKHFESHTKLLPGCWGVIRLDGRRFTRFCKQHSLQKPNDIRALRLANRAALSVLESFDGELILAYGQSDEYSFVLRRESVVFSRRHEKILSTVVSIFTANYVRYWDEYMNGIKMMDTPSFDGRIVLYPTTKHLRDYLAWRQADVHVNNLFNTTFWALVQNGGMNYEQANMRLKDTTSAQKNEILFSQFGINYNDELQIFRKGTVIIKNPECLQNDRKAASQGKRKRKQDDTQTDQTNGEDKQKQLTFEKTDQFLTQHIDIIGDTFWAENGHLLDPPDHMPPRIKKC